MSKGFSGQGMMTVVCVWLPCCYKKCSVRYYISTVILVTLEQHLL